MQNIKTDIKGNTLTITVDLSQSGQRSASGKSIVIASTHGNTGIVHNGETISVGVNVYKKG